MSHLSHQEITILFFSLAILLTLARFLGEVAMRFHQPAILGEILAGILLGPTVLGIIAPGIQDFLFPSEKHLSLVLHGLTTVAITLFLLVAGMEVDLSSVWRQGRMALMISLFGMIIPFAIGFFAASYFPQFFGAQMEADYFIFALFMGTAFSISALPVIAKTMMDLNLYRSDLGMLVISVAIINDIVGWLIFAVILGMMGGHTPGGMNVSHTIFYILIFAVFILSIGRWLLDRILPWLQAHTSWPGGILGFALSCALFCAAFTEWIGIHAIFGAFLFGVALGDSRHLRERTRATIDQFVSFFFAPLFFASIGLKVNFITNFDLLLVVVIVVTATISKVLGCTWGARLGGLSSNESWAIGFGMNSRGAMEIILGLLALQAGVIGDRTFVALVIMALLTSMSSGTLMQRFLKPQKLIHFYDFLTAKHFRCRMRATERQEAVHELVRVVCEGTNLNPEMVSHLVWNREQMAPTGLENSVAIPNARLQHLMSPIIAVGFSEEGIDFDARDGQLAKVIFLILTPLDDHRIQLDIIADIAKIFKQSAVIEKAMEAKTYTELLALAKSVSQSVDQI